MSLHNFVALPLFTVAFAATSAYSSPATFAPTPLDNPVQEISEVVTETQDVEMEVNPTQEDSEARETTPEVPTPPTIVETRYNNKIVYTQDEVRLYPIMERICTCESGRQFHADGSVVRGIVNPQDIGMCQINLKYHGATADSLGYDIFTEEGNIRYTNYLYDTQGTQPWYLSGSCHGLS